MLFPLVVVYNKSCKDSETCQTLLKQDYPDVQVLVFDNSVKDFGNRRYCQAQGWQYLGGEGNQGLSRAYNRAVEWLLAQGEEGYICLLDDDTALPDSFFSDMDASMQKHPGRALYVPILRQQGQIISPTRHGASRSKLFFRSEEECLREPEENLGAFNSCMTISLDIFRDYRYDERIFLDCVDHAFLRDMRKKGINPTVLPVVCCHGFSGKQRGSLKGDLARYRILVKDAKIYYGDARLAWLAMTGRRALHLCLQHKTPAFLKTYFSAIF